MSRGGSTAVEDTFVIAALLVSTLSLGCPGDGQGPAYPVDPDASIPDSPSPARCVWNQAYRENGPADSIDDILAQARGCYVLVDPFDDQDLSDVIARLHQAENIVGCYISVGTCEAWRDDFDSIRPFCVDERWDEWDGEYFVDDVDGILPWMEARVARLAALGCDMVELDNMDWAFDEESRRRYGFGVTADQAMTYYQALCEAIHSAGMSCMAKNTRRGAESFDGGTFESWASELDWWEHDELQSFIDGGRLAVVFHYEEQHCDEVTRWYRVRYGSGLSLLCEDEGLGAYRH